MLLLDGPVRLMLGYLLGASYLAGLDQIHKQHYSTAVTVLVIGFNLVMLWLLEVPLAAFVRRVDAARD